MFSIRPIENGSTVTFELNLLSAEPSQRTVRLIVDGKVESKYFTLGPPVVFVSVCFVPFAFCLDISLCIYSLICPHKPQVSMYNQNDKLEFVSLARSEHTNTPSSPTDVPHRWDEH